MLKVNIGIKAKDRENIGIADYGLKIGRTDIPMQIYGAYSTTNSGITYNAMYQVDRNYRLLNTIVNNFTIKYEDGQYLIDVSAGYAADLTDGVYYYLFVNALGYRYSSELFGIAELTITNTGNSPDPKLFEDDRLFEYND